MQSLMVSLCVQLYPGATCSDMSHFLMIWYRQASHYKTYVTCYACVICSIGDMPWGWCIYIYIYVYKRCTWACDIQHWHLYTGPISKGVLFCPYTISIIMRYKVSMFVPKPLQRHFVSFSAPVPVYQRACNTRVPCRGTVLCVLLCPCALYYPTMTTFA